MYTYRGSVADLDRHLREEITFPGDTGKGKRGKVAQRIQEWLCLNGCEVDIDGDFGKVTEIALGDFQSRAKLPKTGTVDQATHDTLVAPMLRSLAPKIDGASAFGEAVVAVANVHLAEHPRETGGDNRGPWVRLYMDGNEGPAWFWCAGFVTFLMRQAAELLDVKMPIEGSMSCDTLAAQAKNAGIFLSEANATPEKITPGSIFLVRRTASDWTHTGIVTRADTEVFGTIEGNTNDDGNRNGYEVCARKRGYGKKDFILL